MRIWLVIWAAANYIHSAAGLGCMVEICEGNPNNELRACPDDDGTCGNYKGVRKGNAFIRAVDIKCDREAAVKAPFNGQMYFWRPFGGWKKKECADQGVRIEGEGQWQGYFALIAYVKPLFAGGHVIAGQTIGHQVDIRCMTDITGNFESFIQFKLYRQGKNVDPTFHLKDCMCTGQICESNKRNDLVGQPFKSDERFNGVRGWELECEDMQEPDEENLVAPEEQQLRAPGVFAPISGQSLGRIRILHEDSKYSGCHNDGLFIVGKDKWQGFVAKLYNVKFLEQPGAEEVGLGNGGVKQGWKIGTRLQCPGEEAISSVYLELRQHGKLVNVTNMILAKKCELPAQDDSMQ